jgi:4-hydroxy-tetrahydrodipicolinate reductase
MHMQQPLNPRIGLMGRGKLGQAILAEAEAHPEQGHIVWAYGREAAAQHLPAAFGEVDVVIECTRPESARSNVLMALEAGKAVVCGSTGWLEALPEVEARCRALGGAFLYAANFSIGVNLFFALNRWLAERMQDWPQYHVHIEETHHTAKRDAPSGTAVHLAEQILSTDSRHSGWHLTDQRGAKTGDASSIPVQAHRIADVPGTHRVGYQSAIDRLEIQHTAHSRRGFAQGALTAARWLPGRSGVFRMEDVLGLPNAKP